MQLSDSLALKIANGIGGTVFANVEFLYDGASSRAWKVTSVHNSYVVRMNLPGVDRPVTYQSELEVFKQLAQRGVPVPQPIATYQDKPIDGVKGAWAVTELVDGQALGSQPMTPQVASDLADALIKIHSSPVSNYGRLEETQGEIKGLQLSPGEGILARYCYGQLWPFDNTPLPDNAAYGRFSAFEDGIQQHEQQIRKIAEDRQVALVHSDLHGKHLFVKNNRLSGVIDFGAAFIGVPDWDFGRLGFEFGWQSTQKVLAAYLKQAHMGVQPVRVYLVALVFTLYKLDRYVREGSPENKIAKGLNFLGQTLALLQKDA